MAAFRVSIVSFLYCGSHNPNQWKKREMYLDKNGFFGPDKIERNIYDYFERIRGSPVNIDIVYTE